MQQLPQDNRYIRHLHRERLPSKQSIDEADTPELILAEKRQSKEDNPDLRRKICCIRQVGSIPLSLSANDDAPLA
jgi:hypothetical protein